MSDGDLDIRGRPHRFMREALIVTMPLVVAGPVLLGVSILRPERDWVSWLAGVGGLLFLAVAAGTYWRARRRLRQRRQESR